MGKWQREIFKVLVTGVISKKRCKEGRKVLWG
jgi:hypothetical protein